MKRSKQTRNATRRAQRAETMPPRVSKYAAKKRAQEAAQDQPRIEMTSGPDWTHGRCKSSNKQAGMVDVYLLRKIMIGITVFGIVSIAFNITRMFG